MENKIILFLICFLFFSSIGNAGLFYLSTFEEDLALDAISNNDLLKLQSIVGNKKSNIYLISAALSNESSNARYTCKTEIVKFLLKVGSKVHYESLTPAVFNLCPEIFQMLLPKSSDYEVALAALEFNTFDNEEYTSRVKQNPNFSGNISIENFTERVKKIESILISENKKRCSPSNKLNKNCEALEHMQNEFNKAEEREKNRQYQEGAEGVLNEACEALYDINTEQGYINTQREIARTSGVVDRKILYESGARIVEARKEIKNLKQKYLLKTKKNLPLNLCYKT